MDILFLALGLVLRISARGTSNRRMALAGNALVLVGLAFLFGTGVPVAIRSWRGLRQPVAPALPAAETVDDLIKPYDGAWMMGPVQITVPSSWHSQRAAKPSVQAALEMEFTEPLSGGLLVVSVMPRQANRSIQDGHFDEELKRKMEREANGRGGAMQSWTASVAQLGSFTARRFDSVVGPADPNRPGQAGSAHFVHYFADIDEWAVGAMYFLPIERYEDDAARFESVLSTVKPGSYPTVSGAEGVRQSPGQ